MKNKNTLFLSAALTAFVIVMLVSVVTVVNNLSNPAIAQAANTSNTSSDSVQTDSPTLIVNTVDPVEAASNYPSAILPQDAALLAAQMLNRQDLYSVETLSLDGTNVYKVTFVNGDTMIMSLNGRVVSMNLQPATITTVSNTNVVVEKEYQSNQTKQKSSDSGSSSGEHESEHDGGDDHGGGGGGDD
jgi:uncharacterized membrane protein YgcG